MSLYDEIIGKIEDKSIKVGIIGLGYVGLPLAVSFARKGVNVLGFEKSLKKFEAVNAGKNYISDIKDEELADVVMKNKLSACMDFTRIAECQALIICVPTPLDRYKKPDMNFIEGSCVDIGKYMKRGSFISLESTTYPTTTEDFIKPIIERESGMKEGNDFWLCFSPERVDPGNKDYKTVSAPLTQGVGYPNTIAIGPEIR